MDHYEMEYRAHFLEVRLHQLSRGGGPFEYWAEVRVSAGPAGVLVCHWASLHDDDAGTFSSPDDALSEGMTRGIAHVDALLKGQAPEVEGAGHHRDAAM